MQGSTGMKGKGSVPQGMGAKSEELQELINLRYNNVLPSLL